MGNKSDKTTQIEITKETAINTQKLHGFQEYFETSAKDLKGVDDCFDFIIKKAVETLPQAVPNNNTASGFSIHNDPEPEAKPEKKKCPC